MPAGLDDKFLEVVAWLKGHADDRAKAVTREGDGGWATFLGVGPLDLPAAASAFSRDDIGEAYLGALTDPAGTLGDAASLKLQGDYVACAQRAHALRHATKARRAVWSAARLRGHAAAGGVFDRVEAAAADLVTAGGAGFDPQVPADPDALLDLAVAENLEMGRRPPP